MYIINFNKLKLFILLITSLLPIISCGGDSGNNNINNIGSTSILTGDKAPGNSTWTIMVYIDGDNNLEEYALKDINEMELVDLSGEGITVIVLVDRNASYSTADGNWNGTRLYKIKADSDTSTINSERLADGTYLNLTSTGDTEELNMGASSTVTNFIDFCKNNYTADNYAFIFWNHGGGWRNSESSSDKSSAESNNINKAVCWDATSSNDCLYMSEVESSISGKGLNVIGFDACLMSMVEVMYQLKDTGAQYVIASSANIPASGWVYNRFLHNVINLSDNSGLNISKCAVDTYIDYTSIDDITLSVIDLSKINSLASAISTFSVNLMSADANDICSARYSTLSYSGEPFIDIYHFAENLSSISGASSLITAINNAVVYHRDNGYTEAHGLSIYYPIYSTMDSEYSSYNSSIIDFPGGVQWDEFLADYYSNLAIYTIETFPNGGTNSSSTDTYITIYDENMNIIDEDDNSGTNSFSKLEIPLIKGSIYFILIEGSDSYDTGFYSILFNLSGGGSSTVTPATSAFESNNAINTATVLPYDAVQDHYLTSSDVDYFKITVPSP